MVQLKGTSTEVLKSAPPPWHSILLLVSVALISASRLPETISSFDDETTRRAIVDPLFDDVISQLELGWIRIAFATFIFFITQRSLRSPPISLKIPYSKSSKLRSVPFQLGSVKKQFFFTRITWNLLGISFALNGILALCAHYDWYNDWLSSNRWIYRVALWMFEVVAPNSLLVSFVVRYSIWPANLKKNIPTLNLRSFESLMQHNANLLMSLVEVGLLGKIPVRITDIPIGIFYQLLYVLMMWNLNNFWYPEGGPQYLYHFMDTTVGYVTTVSLIVLLLISMVFNILFASLGFILEYLNGSIMFHGIFILLVFSTMSRFRD